MHVDGDAAELSGPAVRVAVAGAHGDDDAARRDAVRPAEPGHQALDPGVLGENPFLPFPYFYDQTTWSYSLLRGFSGDGFLTQPLPAGTSMSLVFDPNATTPAPAGSPVYAFNTDSMAGLAMVNQLLGQGASVSRGAAAFDSGGVHFATGAALVDGTSIPLATLNADSQQWGTPVYGLSSYPVSRYALRLPKIGIYTGATTAPTNPTFKGAGDGQCTSTVYCEAMYDLSVKEKIPVSQLGQITSTDLANGVLVSQGYTAFVNPNATAIPAGAGATALQAFVNGGGVYIGSGANAVTSARNAGITLLNTSTITGLSTPGSTFDGVFSTSTAAGWGFDKGGWIYRSASGDPTFNPATMVGNGTTIPAPTAVVTYGPSGDCGGPVFDISSTARGYSNCYGYQVNANSTLPAANSSTPLPGRPAVVDQPFGAGHAILIGFDAWYRMWTWQEERLVLNGVLYPSGSAIPPSSAAAARQLQALHVASKAKPLVRTSLPRIANRPLRVQPTRREEHAGQEREDHEVSDSPTGSTDGRSPAGRAPVYFLTKLTDPLLSRIPHCTSSKDPIDCIRISSASSSGVIRWRRRFCSRTLPSWITTIGWPSSTFRTRRERKLTYETSTCNAAIVAIAITAPVTE